MRGVVETIETIETVERACDMENGNVDADGNGENGEDGENDGYGEDGKNGHEDIGRIFKRFLTDVRLNASMERALAGRVNSRQRPKRQADSDDSDDSDNALADDDDNDKGENPLLHSSLHRMRRVVRACAEARAAHDSITTTEALDDATLSRLARFVDCDALSLYSRFLHYVPRLVNCVTLAEAFPVPGTGLKLPLNLNFIASRCAGAYFAPKRFAAVQFAYQNPRARVLIFRKSMCSNASPHLLLTRRRLTCADTGRLVGTGIRGRFKIRPRLHIDNWLVMYRY